MCSSQQLFSPSRGEAGAQSCEPKLMLLHHLQAHHQIKRAQLRSGCEQVKSCLDIRKFSAKFISPFKRILGRSAFKI